MEDGFLKPKGLTHSRTGVLLHGSILRRVHVPAPRHCPETMAEARAAATNIHEVPCKEQ